MSLEGMEGDAKRRYFAGESLQQALVQAANYHNLNPEVIAYRQVEKRHGFLKTVRKVVIEVDPDSPRRGPGDPAPPVRPVSAAPAEDLGNVAPAAARPERGPKPGGRGDRGRGGPRDRRGDRRGDNERGRSRPPREREVDSGRLPPPALPGMVRLGETARPMAERLSPASGPAAEAAVKVAELLLRVAGLELEPKVYEGDGRLEIDLTGADVDWCFADDGDVVMAIEHLLPRMVRSLCGESVAFRVDCDNFHEIREERLRVLAQRMAEDVKKSGRPRILEPMNPADRRVVHITLADDPAVETESAGDGFFKRVTIRPA